MPIVKLKEFLDAQQIKYVQITHSRAYTAQEIAASAHIPGKELAKTVMVKIDGQMAMAVLPASHQVDLKKLASDQNMHASTQCPGPEVRCLGGLGSAELDGDAETCGASRYLHGWCPG